MSKRKKAQSYIGKRIYVPDFLETKTLLVQSVELVDPQEIYHYNSSKSLILAFRGALCNGSDGAPDPNTIGYVPVNSRVRHRVIK